MQNRDEAVNFGGVRYGGVLKCAQPPRDTKKSYRMQFRTSHSSDKTSLLPNVVSSASFPDIRTHQQIEMQEDGVKIEVFIVFLSVSAEVSRCVL